MPKFDTVFFDSGGTLYGPGDGSGPSASEVGAGRVARLSAMLCAFGHSMDVGILEEQMRLCEKEVSAEHGDAYTFFRMVKELVKRLDLPLGPEEAAVLADAYAGPRYAAWLLPGTHRVLATLHEHGIYMGIIANTAWTGFSMDRAFDGVGLLPYLSTRIYSGDVGISKPDPRIFHLAACTAGRKGDRSLYVGNDLEKDVQGASAVGWSTAFRVAGGRGSNGLADFDFVETEQLLEFIGVAS